MKKEIISAISSIIINIVSNSLDSEKMKTVEKYYFWRFRKDIKKWARRFIKKNDGTVLTRGPFEQYFVNQNPTEKIYNYVLTEESKESENDFILCLVRECKESIVGKHGKCDVLDQSILKEFFGEILYKLKQFLYARLDINAQYILFIQRQSEANIKQEIHSQGKVLLDGIDEIKEILSQQNQITDIDVIDNIYKIINNKLWNGQIEEVWRLLPVIIGKNNDLELGINCSLKIMSDYELPLVNPWADIDKINNDNIRDDIKQQKGN